VRFEKMQCVWCERNKTGYSTDVQTLEELKGYPIATCCCNTGSLQNMKSTYIDTLPRLFASKQA
jgi:DNA polymerase I-like protein with 3'-5' exonuclease and polymerase domains